MEKIKGFLLKNVNSIILAGQMLLVVIVCVAGIKNDLQPDCKKKKKKKRKMK